MAKCSQLPILLLQGGCHQKEGGIRLGQIWSWREQGGRPLSVFNQCLLSLKTLPAQQY